MSHDRFISQFCQWGYNGGLPNQSAKKLSGVLRKIINKELPSRDELVHVFIRDFTNSSNLSFSFAINHIYCKPIPNEHLLVGVTMPFWKRGLRSVIKDECLYDAISWFFHYASQYVGRSRMVDLIGAVALTYNRPCDFRGKSFREFYCSNNSTDINKAMEEVFSSVSTDISGKRRELLAWFNLLNSLDPFINRIIFNYVRAIELYADNYTEEAVVALDSTVNVAEQFVRERLGVVENNQREAMVRILGLGDRHDINLKQIYNLRCHFGAHPSASKWWDFYEIYEGDFERLFKSVQFVIYKIVLEEQKNRIVEKFPVSWSAWFKQNAMLLWDAVWFHRIP